MSQMDVIITLYLHDTVKGNICYYAQSAETRINLWYSFQDLWHKLKALSPLHFMSHF